MGARTVAAFDFDGTLIRGDSLLGFLRLACGARATALAFAGQGPMVATSLARGGGLERDVAKAAILARLLAGRRLADLEPLAEVHASHLAARVRPVMRARIAAHRAAGHEVVLVSASPEIYLARMGQLLGVDAVLATRLEVDPDGRLTGRLDGPNCRGPEKAVRLRAWLHAATPHVPGPPCAPGTGGPARPGRGDRAGPVPVAAPATGGPDPVAAPATWLHAYGDSAGDVDLLAMADVPVWVGRRAWTRRRQSGGRPS
ncbi:MAG: HAD-IB family hydrolase [Acidimicrobiales bacterium]